jgi:hypothetical protein
MTDCAHTRTETATIKKELQGHFFTAQTRVCKDCGAELWDEKLNVDFNNWVNEIKVKPRIQFKMSNMAEQCLDHILLKFPGANKTILVRAMIAVYLDLLKKGPDINHIFNQLYDSEFYGTFEEDHISKMFQTDVRAVFFFDIQSWGKSFELKPNEMAAEAFHLMMALCVSEDQDLKNFWNTMILPQIETIVKAA